MTRETNTNEMTTVKQTTGHGHTKKNKYKKRIIVANL